MKQNIENSSQLTWDDVKQDMKKVNVASKQIIEDMEILASIVVTIVQKRNQLGYSQRDLAKLCGIPRSTLARIEGFDVNPNFDTLCKILRQLGLKLVITEI